MQHDQIAFLTRSVAGHGQLQNHAQAFCSLLGLQLELRDRLLGYREYS